MLCDPLDTGAGITIRTDHATLPEALAGKYGDWRWCQALPGPYPPSPVQDTEVKASGTGSLKFTGASNTGAAAGGSCQVNFTPTNSVQFGEGETFFVQFRVRFSCDLLFIDCNPDSATYRQQRRTFRAKDGRPTAFKVSIFTAGDHKDLKFPVSACTSEQLVLGDRGGGIIGGYHSCNWYDGHARGLRLHRKSGLSFVDFQPTQQERSKDPAEHGCYNIDPGTGQPLTSAWRGCALCGGRMSG